MSMKEQIAQRARELGFNDCRFTTAAAPGSARHFQHWLDRGQQGEMGYLARNAHKRVEPKHVLAEARSIIMLAASYAGAETAAPTHRGVVARYARHADYHEVLAAPLRELKPTKFCHFRSHFMGLIFGTRT